MTEEATLPLRWFCQLPLCRLAPLNDCKAIIQSQQVFLLPIHPDRRKEVISMPCPRLDIDVVQRSANQSAVAAAYQSGEKLYSEYDRDQKL